MALFLILITLLISLVPVLSAIGIIDHIDHIESGGIYFVLTHILGARIGATVGILYCFGQVSNGRLISLRSMSLITLSISLFNHEFTILIFTSIDNYTMYFPPFLSSHPGLANLWLRQLVGIIIGLLELLLSLQHS